MKTKIIKILGIALTIALLSSLFVFAAPVSAKNNPEFFTATTIFTLTSPPSMVTEYMGNGYIVRVETVSEYVVTGDFGPGTAVGTARGVINLNTGQSNFSVCMEIDYPGQGTIVAEGAGRRASYGAEQSSNWVIISGTDAYENLHGHGTSVATITGSVSTGTYHYAPD